MANRFWICDEGSKKQPRTNRVNEKMRFWLAPQPVKSNKFPSIAKSFPVLAAKIVNDFRSCRKKEKKKQFCAFSELNKSFRVEEFKQKRKTFRKLLFNSNAIIFVSAKCACSLLKHNFRSGGICLKASAMNLCFIRNL